MMCLMPQKNHCRYHAYRYHTPNGATHIMHLRSIYRYHAPNGATDIIYPYYTSTHITPLTGLPILSTDIMLLWSREWNKKKRAIRTAFCTVFMARFVAINANLRLSLVKQKRYFQPRQRGCLFRTQIKQITHGLRWIFYPPYGDREVNFRLIWFLIDIYQIIHKIRVKSIKSVSSYVQHKLFS